MSSCKQVDGRGTISAWYNNMVIRPHNEQLVRDLSTSAEQGFQRHAAAACYDKMNLKQSCCNLCDPCLLLLLFNLDKAYFVGFIFNGAAEMKEETGDGFVMGSRVINAEVSPPPPDVLKEPVLMTFEKLMVRVYQKGLSGLSNKLLVKSLNIIIIAANREDYDCDYD